MEEQEHAWARNPEVCGEGQEASRSYKRMRKMGPQEGHDSTRFHLLTKPPLAASCRHTDSVTAVDTGTNGINTDVSLSHYFFCVTWGNPYIKGIKWILPK